MKNIILVIALFVIVTASPAHAWRAYNDLRWAPDDDTEPTNNITLYSWTNNTSGPSYIPGGELKNYDTGADTGVTLSMTSDDPYSSSYTNQGAISDAGTDGYAVFNGIVGCKGLMSNGDVTLTFTNLDTALTYNLVIFANRDEVGYTDRYGLFTILDADSFTNLSSSGTTTTTNSTEFCTGYNTTNGYVARFSHIAPGDDTAFKITLESGPQGSAGKGKYITALMLETETETGLLLELSGTKPLKQMLCLLGLGMMLCGCVLRRRSGMKSPCTLRGKGWGRMLWLMLFTGLFLGAGVMAAEVMGPVGVLRLEVQDSNEIPRALVSLPFHPLGDGSLADVLTDQLDGGALDTADRVLKWNRMEQRYAPFTLGADSKWYDEEGLETTLELNPGEGFWVELRQSEGKGRDIYFVGEVVLSDTEVQFLYPGLSLFGQAFASRASLNEQSGLAESGASDGLSPESADKVIEADGQTYYWLKDVAPVPLWMNAEGKETEKALEPGQSYWYSRKEIDVMAWRAARPYADVFASSNVPPYVAAIAVDTEQSEVVLTIVCAGEPGETLDVLYKDMEPEESFVSHKDWLVAEKGFAVEGQGPLEWRDKGGKGRKSLDKVGGRFYLVGRGDIDMDLNGVSDFRQRFVLGEEVAAQQEPAPEGEGTAPGGLEGMAPITMGGDSGGPPMGPLGEGGGGATNFVAYNDLGWEAGELTNNITLYNHVNSTNGLLVDYDTGTELDVEVHLGLVDVGTATIQSIGDNNPDTGSDAYEVFNGIVDCDTSTRWTNGTLQILFTGLDADTRYEFAMFGNRSKYSDRLMDTVISDVGTFRNESSDEATVWTADRYKDTGRITATNDAGYIWQYTQIDPGADGDFLISVTRSGSSGYINAFMLRTVASDGIYSMDTRVSASIDDVEEAPDGSINTNSTDLELIEDVSEQTVGIRFSSVAIPENATITSALIQFKTDETSSQSTTLAIAAQATNNAPAFTISTSNVTSRTQTSDSVLWEPSAWGTVGECAEDQCTEDIGRVIQEIVDLDGWQSSNAVAIIISGTGKRIAESYDGDVDGAPLLHVEYSLGTTISFQDGVYPDASYDGTRDTMLAADNPTQNYGTTNSLGADGTPDEGVLLQWNLSDIPAGAIVTEASIVLQITDPTGAGTDYSLYGLKRAWSETNATWNIADTGDSWGSAGAQGSDDRRSTAVGSFCPTNTGVWTVELNDEGVALVQAWIEASSVNHGILIENYDAVNGLNLSSREAATAANRPKLNITYSTNILSRCFQDGVSPSVNYAGTRDTTLRDSAQTTNYGTNTVIELDGDDSDETGLVKWDISSLPSVCVIESASMELNVANGSEQAYEFYQLLRGWVETTATWNVADTGESWTTAGAQGSGDRDTTVLGSLDTASSGKATVSLNASGVAVVQSWVDGTGTNEGGIFQNFASGDGCDFDSREVTTETDRPALTVTYYYYPDQDADTLPDWWEVAYFDAATNAVSGDDDDSDELTNLEEYRYSTDPTDADTDDDGLDDAVELAYGLDPTVSNSFMGLPFADDFEEYDPWGDIDGYNGWVVSVPDMAVASTNESHGGEQSCEISAASTPVVVTHFFNTPDDDVVWTDFYVKPVRRTVTTTPTLSDPLTMALYVDACGQIVAWDGTNEWQTLTNSPLAENEWVRLSIGKDFTNNTWELRVDDESLATGLCIDTNSLLEMTRLRIVGGSERNVYIDDVAVDTAEPDFDSDGDGLLDSWEMSQFENLDETASGDTDGDGISNALEYLYGSSAYTNDTDGDRVLDNYEIYTNKTDWLVADTDGDGANDYDDLNPTVADENSNPGDLSVTVEDPENGENILW